MVDQRTLTPLVVVRVHVPQHFISSWCLQGIHCESSYQCEGFSVSVALIDL